LTEERGERYESKDHTMETTISAHAASAVEWDLRAIPARASETRGLARGRAIDRDASRHIVPPPPHVLRALATEPGIAGTWRGRLAALRPAFDVAFDGIRGTDAASARSRFVDNTIVGLVHLARICVATRGDAESGRLSMMAPIAVVAIGSYGRRALTADGGIELVCLLPAPTRIHRFADAVCRQLLLAMQELGFEANAIVGTPREVGMILRLVPSIRSRCRSRRLVWGSDSLEFDLADESCPPVSRPQRRKTG
jgi:hypothetical protein